MLEIIMGISLSLLKYLGRHSVKTFKIKQNEIGGM